MSKYVESHLGRNENIVLKAKLTPLFLVGTWFKGILFCWLLLIPTIKAIIATIQYFNIELAITDKRIVGKIGVIKTRTLDAPLNKIQNTSTNSGLWGKIFGYGCVTIDTAAGSYSFPGVQKCESFKGAVMNQIDEYEEQKIKDQAAQMANAMSSVLNK